jgi:hypothetical protein
VSNSADRTWGFRLSPREWLPLTRQVRNSPGDVVTGARVFFAIGGHDEEPTHRRFLRSETGARLVRDAATYPALFTDYDGLRSLARGTLGFQYVRELDERGHPCAGTVPAAEAR